MLPNKTQAILAILATVLFIALITLQVLELMHYSSPPSVWPGRFRPMKALLFTLLFLAGLGVTGCATRDPDAESDIPWNSPQSWEGAPGIPGLETR